MVVCLTLPGLPPNVVGTGNCVEGGGGRIKGCIAEGWEELEVERVGTEFAATACGCDAGVRFVRKSGKSRSD